MAKFFIVITIIKLLMAAFLPITPDEAEYAYWGEGFVWSYYEHPPMLGWVNHLISLVSSHQFALRLVPIGSSLLISWFIYLFTKWISKDKASLAALAFYASPFSLLNVLIHIEAVLGIFVVLVGLLLTSEKSPLNARRFALAVFFVGLCLLTKFSVLPFLIALTIYLLRQRQVSFTYVAIALIVLTPFTVYILEANQKVCWLTLLSAFGRANHLATFKISNVFSLLLQVIYLAGPWTVYFLWQQRQKISGQTRKTLLLFLFTMAPFTLIALNRSISIHWLMPFMPFLFASLLFLDREKIWRIARANVSFSIFHLVLLVVIVCLPTDLFQGKDFHKYLAFYWGQEEVCEKLKPSFTAPNTIVTTDNYGFGAMLRYTCKQPILTINSQSFHGRSHDILNDYRNLEGKNIVHFSVFNISEDEFTTFLQHVTMETFPVNGASMKIARGEQASFVAYKNSVLRQTKERFYQHECLQKDQSCFFYQQYFPEEAGPAKSTWEHVQCLL